MPNKPSIRIPEAPLGCKYQNDSLSVSSIYYTIVIILAFLMLLLAILHHFFPSLTESSGTVFNGIFTTFLFLTITILVYFSRQVPKECSLDKEGFHYKAVYSDYGIFSPIMTFYYTVVSPGYKTVTGDINIDIPLLDILKFRLQNDDSGVFVEVVTKNKFYRLFHHRSRNKTGTNFQNWLVIAGNYVLSNLTRRNCHEINITEDSCASTVLRLKRNVFIENIEKTESIHLNIQSKSDSLRLESKKIFEGNVLRSLFIGLALLGLTVCLLIFTKLFFQTDITILMCIGALLVAAAILSFLFSIVCFVHPISFTIDFIISFYNVKQWIFTDKTVTKQQTQFGIPYARQIIDSKQFSYMEIQNNVYVEKQKDFDLNYRLVLYNNNDRIILEINDLELNEAAWIANEIQKVINGSAPNPIYRSLAQ